MSEVKHVNLFCDEHPKHRRLYLQTLCNKWDDFRVAKTFKIKDGEIGWSKWRSVLDCSHSDEGLLFLDTVNNRTILPCEIVLDVDTNIGIQNLNNICDAIEVYNMSYNAYHSGSKGYHVHIYVKGLAECKNHKREIYRDHVIGQLKCDLMKKSDKSMIAIEECKHWKTGQKKMLVRSYDGHRFK